MSVQFLDRQALLNRLCGLELNQLADIVQRRCHQRFSYQRDGHLQGWEQAWNELPAIPAELQMSDEAVAVVTRDATTLESVPQEKLRETLMKLHPWRKGPFHFLGQEIDTEWKSNWKWDRFAGHLDFGKKRILDVGCGNGYYGWRMLHAGAEWVLGCEPFMLPLVQFEFFRRYATEPERQFVVPLADTDLPRNLHFFDITFSMGVLYHSPNPIQHLQILHSTLRPNGNLVLETLAIEDSDSDVLVPKNRYAKMRNVWFIPSLSMLEIWLQRTGFREIQVLDVTATTTDEQRSTPWMRFESLIDFLDPSDNRKTIEGYPAPRRAVLVARANPQRR